MPVSSFVVSYHINQLCLIESFLLLLLVFLCYIHIVNYPVDNLTNPIAISNLALLFTPKLVALVEIIFMQMKIMHYLFELSCFNLHHCLRYA